MIHTILAVYYFRDLSDNRTAAINFVYHQSEDFNQCQNYYTSQISMSTDSISVTITTCALIVAMLCKATTLAICYTIQHATKLPTTNL